MEFELIEDVSKEAALAEKVVTVMHCYDPYQYHDTYDSDEEAACAALQDIMDGGLRTIEMLAGMCLNLMKDLDELMED